jgi:hypothetical protein
MSFGMGRATAQLGAPSRSPFRVFEKEENQMRIMFLKIKFVIVLLMIMLTAPAMAMDGPCVDSNVGVATERLNMQAFINIREALQTGNHSQEQVIAYLNGLIDMDAKFIDTMERLGFPGYPVSGTVCDSINVIWARHVARFRGIAGRQFRRFKLGK